MGQGLDNLSVVVGKRQKSEAVVLLLLTAIGLSPGGSSPTLVQRKIKIHKTTITTKNYKT
jgi:hypothetical protein